MLSQVEWDALCDGCAKCCDLGKSGVACPSLDVTTNRCTVYERRTETECCVRVTPDNVLQLHSRGILPDSCAYVRYKKGLSKLDSPEKAKLVSFSNAPLWFRDAYVTQRDAWLLSDRSIEPDGAGEV